jgi:hypothetical protein
MLGFFQKGEEKIDKSAIKSRKHAGEKQPPSP